MSYAVTRKSAARPAMSRAYASRWPPVPCSSTRSGPDPARSTRVRTPCTSTWRSSWSVSASSPQMLMCSGRSVMAAPQGIGCVVGEPGARLGDGGEARALPAGDAERLQEAGVLDGEELGRLAGRIVVVAVPGPRRRIDEVAGRPRLGVVLDVTVAVAGDDVVHRLVVVPLHVRALAGRDRLPEQLECRGRQAAGDRQRGRVVDARGRERFELGGVHHSRPGGARTDCGAEC